MIGCLFKGKNLEKIRTKRFGDDPETNSKSLLFILVIAIDDELQRGQCYHPQIKGYAYHGSGDS